MRRFGATQKFRKTRFVKWGLDTGDRNGILGCPIVDTTFDNQEIAMIVRELIDALSRLDAQDAPVWAQGVFEVEVVEEDKDESGTYVDLSSRLRKTSSVKI